MSVCAIAEDQRMKNANLKTSPDNGLIAACAVDLSGSTGDARRIIPAGSFDAPNGSLKGQGPWVLDRQSAELLIARGHQRSTDIVVDYEHQSLLSNQNGQPAPASGWLKPDTLEFRDDGLYGVIEWTAAAKKAIEAKEYRYLSPVFTYDRETKHPLDLLQVALTNTPAIDGGGVQALAAARSAFKQPADIAPGSQSNSEEDDPMDLKQIAEALGLKNDADEKAVLGAVAALRKADADLAALRKELEVSDDGDPKEAIAALKAGSADSVPREVYDEMASKVAALKAGSDQAQKDKLIEEGLADGRIPGEATAKWLKTQDLAVLTKHLEDAKPLAALKGMQTGGKKPAADKDGGEGDLSEADLAVCKAMNIKPEDYSKANA
ncbi:MAG: protease (I) and scaffold (Z) protein [Thalassospira sp.]|nr:protease (I) and scaffold (Z) protein [Thalassospira sp.]|tara:strand:+ start:2051 stop:3187 length:1137 start_codon:yes stop_codon:yes gene_type:complete